MTRLIMPSLKLTLIFTVLTGFAYPLLVTSLAHLFFRDQAHGSLIVRNGHITGSTLIAQKFAADRYFWPRPSASDFGTVPSGASNLGPTSRILRSNVLSRIEGVQRMLSIPADGSVPADLVFQSGSGIDPDITPAAARLQIHRVALARHLPEAKLRAVVAQCTEPPQFGLLGEARVNVLLLNLAVDRL